MQVIDTYTNALKKKKNPLPQRSTTLAAIDKLPMTTYTHKKSMEEALKCWKLRGKFGMLKNRRRKNLGVGWGCGGRGEENNRTIIGESCHKCDFCRDKHMFVMTKHVFCHNKNVCHDKHIFVMTKVDKHNFVATKVLLRQAYFCCNKHVFVATKVSLCCDKSMLVATKLLSQQTRVCLDKYLSQQKFCHDKNILSRPTQKHLSRQKWNLWQLPPMIENRQTTH